VGVSFEITGIVKGPAGSAKASVVATVRIPPGKNESCWKSMDCMAAKAAAVSKSELGASIT
jgi:hypothetical protein